MERHDGYEFEMEYDIKVGWVYVVHSANCYPYDDGKIESKDWFDTKQEARGAAIGHIELLLSGEG